MAICAIFKNEGPYLAEWVAFHRLMGVDEFYLYDNASTDDWQRVLLPDLKAGRVRVQPWSVSPRHAQLTAYRHCLEQQRARARWIAFIDVDEFLFSPTGQSLPQVLSDFAGHPGVVAAWRVYGTSGRKAPPSGLVTESYLTRAADDHFLSTYGKPIVDPRRTISLVQSPHCFHHYDPRKPWRLAPPVDELGAPFSGQCSSADFLRINHYYSKSEAEAIAKWRRGSVTHDAPQVVPLEQFLDPRLNEVRDDVILRFLPELRKTAPFRP